jgi:hypothetical protein
MNGDQVSVVGQILMDLIIGLTLEVMMVGHYLLVVQS